MTRPTLRSPRPITGRTVLVIAVAAFSVVIGANLAMLFAATGSFPGLVVENSYVASQGWDARTAAQSALGWEARLVHDGRVLEARIADRTGAPVTGLAVRATIGRPANSGTDRVLTLTGAGGVYRAPVVLEPGQWRIELTAEAGSGPAYAIASELYVPRPD